MNYLEMTTKTVIKLWFLIVVLSVFSLWLVHEERKAKR